jgi:tripartite-type tricarboxylate transporter receptor subunit TctC
MIGRPYFSAAFGLALAGALSLHPDSGLRPAAAAYPERYLTIICASGAGGIVDVTTRLLAEHMSRTLGRTVVVQNEPGAGSTLAIAAVAKAPPDGYTLLTIGPGVSVTAELYPNTTVDVRRDLQPVSVMGAAPLVLLTHKDVPVSDYATLVAYLKAHPGELTTGSNGRGSAGHLAGALFKSMAGVDIRYIPRHPHLRRARPQGLRGHHLDQHVSAQGGATGDHRQAHCRARCSARRSGLARALRPDRHHRAAHHRAGVPRQVSQVRDRQMGGDFAHQQGYGLRAKGHLICGAPRHGVPRPARGERAKRHGE